MKRFQVTVREMVKTSFTVDCRDEETLNRWMDSEDFADVVSEHINEQVVEDRDSSYEETAVDVLNDSDYTVTGTSRFTLFRPIKWNEGKGQ